MKSATINLPRCVLQPANGRRRGPRGWWGEGGAGAVDYFIDGEKVAGKTIAVAAVASCNKMACHGWRCCHAATFPHFPLQLQP